MKNIKKIIVPILTMIILFVFTACGSNKAPSASNGQKNGDNSSTGTKTIGSIKIGTVGVPIGPILVGINDGSYEKAGLKIQTVSFNSGADAVQAFVGGSLDLNLGGYEHVLNQITNGLDVKAYALLNNGSSYQLLVKNDSPLKTLTDVKGKILGVTKAGSLSDTTLKEVLREVKLNPAKDVQIVNAGTGPTMLAAIKNGSVAAGMVGEPTTSQMVVSGDYRVLYDPSFETAGLVIMGKTKWVEKNSEAFKVFLKVTKEVAQRSVADPKGAAKVLKKQFPNLSDEVLTRAVTKVFARVPADLKVTEAGTNQVLETQLNAKVIPKKITYKESVDLSYLPN